jgi:RNA polymerase primary sigma factor
VSPSRGERISGLSRYLRDISAFPLLDPESERELGRRARQGDSAALCRLVESNLRFVVSIAWRYRRAGVSFLDLIHEGNLGLMAASRRYDPSRSNRFLTYAAFFVREAVLAAVRRQASAVPLPERRGKLIAKLRRTLASLEQELARMPSEEELVRESGLSEVQVRWFLSRMGGDVSLDGTGEETDRELAAREPEGTLEEQAVRNSTFRALRAAMGGLSPRERRVIRGRFGLGGRPPLTLAGIAREIRVSTERVRQIEQRALQKLKDSPLLATRTRG